MTATPHSGRTSLCVCVCVAVSRQQEESLWIGGWWPAMNYNRHSGVGAALPPSCRVLTDRAQQATTSGPHRCLTYQSRPLLYTHSIPSSRTVFRPRVQTFVGRFLWEELAPPRRRSTNCPLCFPSHPKPNKGKGKGKPGNNPKANGKSDKRDNGFCSSGTRSKRLNPGTTCCCQTVFPGLSCDDNGKDEACKKPRTDYKLGRGHLLHKSSTRG